MKTTWILGAGSSISCSQGNFPSIDTFFSKAKELGIISDTLRSVKEEYKDLKKYINDQYGKNILRKDEKINVEELLTILDISRSKSKVNEISILYDHILLIIQKVLSNLHYNQNNDSEYFHLVNNLKKEDSIISFNWDLLLDDAFQRNSVLELKKPDIDNQYTHFIDDFSSKYAYSYISSGIRLPYTEYNAEKGYYLKLHGSIDWGYCENKNCRGFSKVIPLLDYKKSYFCGECNSSLRKLIIPPVLNKQYEQYPMISSIWKAAEKELEISKEIVIWGYSLPPTDFYANWLLHQTKVIEKVIIINPDAKRGNEKITYNNIFLRQLLTPIRHKTQEIEIYEFYSDYVAQLPMSKKYSLNPIYK